eukprot:s1845_g11.t1
MVQGRKSDKKSSFLSLFRPAPCADDLHPFLLLLWFLFLFLLLGLGLHTCCRFGAAGHLHMAQGGSGRSSSLRAPVVSAPAPCADDLHPFLLLLRFLFLFLFLFLLLGLGLLTPRSTPQMHSRSASFSQ